MLPINWQASLRANENSKNNDQVKAVRIVIMTSDTSMQQIEEIGIEWGQDKPRPFNEQLNTLIEAIPDAVFLKDGEGRWLVTNEAAKQLFKLHDIPWQGKTEMELASLHPEYHAVHEGCLATDEKAWQARQLLIDEEIVTMEDGRCLIIESRKMPVFDKEGRRKGLVVIGRDITERKHFEERIQHLAHFDALTGLPNRVLLTDRICQAISQAKRDQESFAVVSLDIDHFKNINDTLGHSIGDELLVKVAKRLRRELRDKDTVSRMGWDEFTLLLPNTNSDGALHACGVILGLIAQPCQIETLELAVSASLVIAIYPEDGVDCETLLKNSDAAMYRAKEEGCNNYCFFTPEMHARSTRNLLLENALHHAIGLNQLQVYYQPQLTTDGRHLIGAEALLRWTHPELGIVTPSEFIPIAEDSGLILKIGEWVLRTATQQLKWWMDAGYAPMIVAVNLSGVQFRQHGLANIVTKILEETQLPPEYLELELTESVMMHNPQAAIAVMSSLHERGIRLSIDDFGTGYSSLSYLKKFKVQKLKIDQSFVRDISTDPDDKAIVVAIISLAKNLGLKTIAEGVETVAQLDLLRELGCDEVQGFYYSKPLPVEQFEEFAAKFSLLSAS